MIVQGDEVFLFIAILWLHIVYQADRSTHIYIESSFTQLTSEHQQHVKTIDRLALKWNWNFYTERQQH